MQSAYAERLDALRRAIEHSGAPLRLRPVRAGMHAVVDVEGVDAEELCGAALAGGIECMPLPAYQSGEGPKINALLLGFGAVAPAALRAGVDRLANIIEAMPKKYS
jgi:DNA-binding transcriptional MocR family regulator